MLRTWSRGCFRTGLVVGLGLLAAGPLSAQQTTGKVQGRVTDAATGAPISGAQVTIEGSTLGNLTNDQGFYFINEVPAGLQAVRATFIGYRPVVVEDERILAGQTTTLNFELEQTAVELEAITVEGERNPLVPRDQTASKAIVTGETVDQLPLDNAGQIVVLQPGVVQTNRGVTIRGGRANEEALFIDGVLVRSFGTGNAQNVTVPTNALEQVDVTVGAFSAEFGEAQSGVISFVTRTGGPRYAGSAEFQTDQLAPDGWRTNFNRFEGTFGGPIAGPLTFFLAGTAQGQDQFRNDGLPDLFVIDGVDTCPDAPQFAGLCTAGEDAIFSLPRQSTAAGANDFVDVAAPNFVPWDNGRTQPFNFADAYVFTGNLNYQLPRGSRVNFSYTRNRTQGYGRGGAFGACVGAGCELGSATPNSLLFRVENFDGALNVQDVFTLGSFLVLTQSANQQLSLDLRASYQTDRFDAGQLRPDWWQDNRDPFLGFNFADAEFLVDEDNFRPLGIDVFDPSDEFINLIRSNGIPADSLQVFPSRNDLAASQSLTGLERNLRYNPWGWDTGFPFSGFATQGGASSDPLGRQARDESRLQLRGSVDWQIGRFNRLKAGAEYLDISVSNTTIPLYTGNTLPEQAEPIRIGAFLQNRLDIGDLVLEGGVRIDHLDPGTEYPRTPGFVFNVPDSLKAGFTRFDTDSRTIVPAFDEPCGGVTPTNPNGTCLSNFVEAEKKTEFSPRLGASFPVTPTSTFRLSYGRFVQTPAFFTTAAIGTLGLLRNTNNDLRSGLSNTNTTFARDVELPSTRTFEFGYRQLIGEDLVLDLAAFNKKQRSGLTFRKLPFEDPTNPGQLFFINVMTNDDFTETNGFEVKVDKAIGNLFQGSLAYSFVDAKGTGSDPFTFTGLVLRAVSNISAITGRPDNPPDVLLPLEQSRTHNIALTTSLQFPADFMEGSVAGAILSDLGVFGILQVASGLPFTKLLNQGLGQVGPPSFAGLNGVPETSLSALETPWQKSFDVRFTKGFDVGRGIGLQLFADLRNPFDLENTNFVFLETANPVNELFRDTFLANALGDNQLDGDNEVDDFDIAAESPANDFNKFMLLRAEQRFGNGDGIFTVAEQNAAFGAVYDANNGVDNFVTSNQQLRLGMRLSF